MTHSSVRESVCVRVSVSTAHIECVCECEWEEKNKKRLKETGKHDLPMRSRIIVWSDSHRKMRHPREQVHFATHAFITCVKKAKASEYSWLMKERKRDVIEEQGHFYFVRYFAWRASLLSRVLLVLLPVLLVSPLLVASFAWDCDTWSTLICSNCSQTSPPLESVGFINKRMRLDVPLFHSLFSATSSA